MNGAGIQFEPLQPLSDDFILDQRQVFFLYLYLNLKMPQNQHLKVQNPNLTRDGNTKGSKYQPIFWMKSKRQSCGTNIRLIPRNWSVFHSTRSLFIFSSYVMGTQKISRKKSDIHISLAESWTPQVSRGRRRGRGMEFTKGVRAGSRRERRKANVIKTARVKAIERGAREVNLEQISIATEQEGWMEPGCFWAWIREDLHSEWRGREWTEVRGGVSSEKWKQSQEDKPQRARWFSWTQIAVINLTAPLKTATNKRDKQLEQLQRWEL